MTEEGKTRLPTGLLAALYPNSLVAAPTSERPATKRAAAGDATPPTEPKTMGGNGKKVLILVDQPCENVLPQAELGFLMNILKACRMEEPDVLIANLHGTDDRNYDSLVARWKPSSVILFGLAPSDISLPLAFPPCRVQRHGQVQYLYATDLKTLGSDDAGKRALWAALRSLFGIT